MGNSVFTNPVSGGGGGSVPAGSDTQVQFNDNAVFGGDAGLTYDKTLNALTVGTFLGAGPGVDFTAGNRDTYGDIQFFTSRSITVDSGYVIGFDIQAGLNTGAALATTTLNPYFGEVTTTVGHTLAGVIAHDNTYRLTMANGVTLAFASNLEFDFFATGSGTVTDFYTQIGAKTIAGIAITNYRDFWSDPPILSAGATIGNYYAFSADDLSTLTVGGVKHFINYADKFIVDSAGALSMKAANAADFLMTMAADNADDATDTWLLKILATGNSMTWTNNSVVQMTLTTAGLLSPVTVQPTTAYKSVDGSTGASGTATAVNTLTVKNGLITVIA